MPSVNDRFLVEMAGALCRARHKLVPIRVYMTAARSAPRSAPAKSQDLRL